MAVDQTAPTGPLRASSLPAVSTIAPWATFTQQTREHVPELRFPQRNVTYQRVLDTDSQVWALYGGYVVPIEGYAWWIDPNGNDLGRVEMYAEDLGLPVGSPASRGLSATEAGAQQLEARQERISLPDEFDFYDMLHEALLAPIFGHHYFEWGGEVERVAGRTLWRLREMAAIHPSTIREIRARPNGFLDWVQQQSSGTGTMTLGSSLVAVQPPRIGPESLIPFVYWPDTTCRWLGRSILRPLYRNWLCKDVLLRVDVTNHERAGGVPWIETDDRYAGVDLQDLQRLASEFRVDEEGGAALPPGALLRLARAGGTDTIASIRYHDEQMAAVWHEMVRQLGSTPNGSRALGSTMVDLEAMGRRGMATWIARTLNRWGGARYWRWNWGDDQRAPALVRFTPPEIEASSVEPQVSTEPPAADPPQAANGEPVTARWAGCSAL